MFPSGFSFKMKLCFKHLFCAFSAGWLENFQCRFGLQTLLYFLFNNFHPKHTLEAATHKNLQWGAVLRRVAMGTALILYLLTTDNKSAERYHQPLNQAEQRHQIQRLLALQKWVSASGFCVSLPQFQVCALPALAINYHISYKICSLVSKEGSIKRQFVCAHSFKFTVYLCFINLEVWSLRFSHLILGFLPFRISSWF